MSFKKPLENRHREHEDTKQKSESLDLTHCARLVAAGQIPFPSHLAADEARELAIEVLRLRRERLVGYIARAIASDIQNASQQ